MHPALQTDDVKRWPLQAKRRYVTRIRAQSMPATLAEWCTQEHLLLEGVLSAFAAECPKLKARVS
jgi:hypothetical protein